MIGYKNRFHGHGSLRFVYKNGEAVRSHLMIIKTVENKHRHESRVAVVISKKVIKGAVKRNRVRRRLYEYMRLRLPHIKGVYDIAIIVLSGEVLAMDHVTLAGQIDQLLSQAGLVD